MPDQNQTQQVLATLDAKTVKKVGEETLVLLTPATGRRFRLQGAIVGSSVEAVVTILDGATAIAKVLVPAKGTVSVQFGEYGIASKAEGNKLQLTVSAEAAVTGTFLGQEDVY